MQSYCITKVEIRHLTRTSFTFYVSNSVPSQNCGAHILPQHLSKIITPYKILGVLLTFAVCLDCWVFLICVSAAVDFQIRKHTCSG